MVADAVLSVRRAQREGRDDRASGGIWLRADMDGTSAKAIDVLLVNLLQRGLAVGMPVSVGRIIEFDDHGGHLMVDDSGGVVYRERGGAMRSVRQVVPFYMQKRTARNNSASGRSGDIMTPPADSAPTN